MPIYGAITDFERSDFRSKFSVYFSLDAGGVGWTSLADALTHVYGREEFRHSHGFPRMVLMLRQWCTELSLTREDRGEPPHVLEGYYGIEKR